LEAEVVIAVVQAKAQVVLGLTKPAIRHMLAVLVVMAEVEREVAFY
jgi:hypothetical protein